MFPGVSGTLQAFSYVSQLALRVHIPDSNVFLLNKFLKTVDIYRASPMHMPHGARASLSAAGADGQIILHDNQWTVGRILLYS